MEAMHPEETAQSINTFIHKVCIQKKWTPFLIACERRMIWDDKAKSSQVLSVKEKQAKKALHIVCEKGCAVDVISFVQAWLKSERYKAFLNVPLKFIPNFM
jgi:hypothetical protein